MSTRATFRSRPMMAAVVLGTALTALGAERVTAAEVPPQAVNDIGRYCTSCWRNPRLPGDAWGDCTPEVVRPLPERGPAARGEMTLRGDGDERREFLRATEAVKKRTKRARKYAGEVESAPDPRLDGDRRLAEERETVRLAARQMLTERQQRILQLSFDGW